MSKTIDLNLDAGEFEQDLASGKEEALYAEVSSVNIACGGHAGTRETMRAAVALATKYGLSIGAHPSFPDRKGFGREVLAMSREALVASLVDQAKNLAAVCREAGVRMRHLKPHGALYNAAAKDEGLALALIETVRRVDGDLVLVGLAGSRGLQLCRDHGIKTAAEAFVDRRYEEDGSLRGRNFADALISDPNGAGEQAVDLALGRGVLAISGKRVEVKAQTLCLHGDTEGSLRIARAVRSALEGNGVVISSISL